MCTIQRESNQKKQKKRATKPTHSKLWTDKATVQSIETGHPPDARKVPYINAIQSIRGSAIVLAPSR